MSDEKEQTRLRQAIMNMCGESHISPKSECKTCLMVNGLFEEYDASITRKAKYDEHIKFLNILVKYETGEEDARVRNIIGMMIKDLEPNAGQEKSAEENLENLGEAIKFDSNGHALRPSWEAKPAPSAPKPSEKKCPDCAGGGWVYDANPEHGADSTKDCLTCDGTGKKSDDSAEAKSLADSGEGLPNPEQVATKDVNSAPSKDESKEFDEVIEWMKRKKAQYENLREREKVKA